MRSENAKAVERLEIFERHAQEIYSEMLSRGLCEVGDEFSLFGGPKDEYGDFKNGVKTWATKEDPENLLMCVTPLLKETV